MGRRVVPSLDFSASQRRERRVGGHEAMASDETKSDATSASDSGVSSCSGSCESASCSCDSECSSCLDPYAEPSPPKPMDELERSFKEMARRLVLQHISTVIREELATSQGLASSTRSTSTTRDAATTNAQSNSRVDDKRTIATQTSDDEEEEKLPPPVTVRLRTIPTIDNSGLAAEKARSRTPVSRGMANAVPRDLLPRAETKAESEERAFAKSVPSVSRPRATSDRSHGASVAPKQFERWRFSLFTRSPDMDVRHVTGDQGSTFSLDTAVGSSDRAREACSATDDTSGFVNLGARSNTARPSSPRERDSEMRIDELVGGPLGGEEKRTTPSYQTIGQHTKPTCGIESRTEFSASLLPRPPTASFSADAKACTTPTTDRQPSRREPTEEKTQGDPFIRLDDLLGSSLRTAAADDNGRAAATDTFSSSRFSFSSTTGSGRPTLDLSSLSLTISEDTRIASGQRSSIYQAYCGLTKLAVKVVARPKSKVANLRVEAEVKALEKLPHHPNLVRHHGFTTLNDSLKRGLVMEQVYGGDSIETLFYRPGHIIFESDKHRIILQVIDALAFLHSHDVPHRDLAWRHALYTYKTPAAIKLIDFGLPSLRLGVSNPGCPSVSPEYASPEVLRGEISRGDIEGWKRSDVFSFTVLLVELLVEEPPWDGELSSFAINAVAKRDRRPYSVENIRVWGKKCPDIEQIVREGWHEDPTRRPSAAEMRRRLCSVFDNTVGSGQDRSSGFSFATTDSRGSSQPTSLSSSFSFSFNLGADFRQSPSATTPGDPKLSSFCQTTPVDEGNHSWQAQSLPPRPTGNTSQSSPFTDRFSASSFDSASPSVSVSLASLKLEISDATRIAIGRRGAVYRASSGFAKLAVKLITKPITPSATESFHKDASSLRLLPDHPHLVRYHGYTPVQSSSFWGIVTDLVVGSQTWIDRLYSPLGRVLAEEKVCILLRVANAVAFLHSRGVTHRDLTLKHVLHAYDSSTKFGLTKLVGFGFPSLRRTFTPEYASPEVLRGDLSHDNHEGWKKSDVFSLAVVVTEILMEKRPWEDEVPMFFVKAMTSRGTRPFKVEDLRLFGERSSELEALVSSAWSMDPRKRPSAMAFQGKLLQILQAKT